MPRPWRIISAEPRPPALATRCGRPTAGLTAGEPCGRRTRHPGRAHSEPRPGLWRHAVIWSPAMKLAGVGLD